MNKVIRRYFLHIDANLSSRLRTVRATDLVQIGYRFLTGILNKNAVLLSEEGVSKELPD